MKPLKTLTTFLVLLLLCYPSHIIQSANQPYTSIKNGLSTVPASGFTSYQNVGQQLLPFEMTLGPGQYEEDRGWMAAPVEQPGYYIKVWWKIDGYINNWIKIAPNPLNVPQGTEKWFTITIAVPEETPPDVYEGTIHCMMQWYNGTTPLTLEQEWRTVELSINVDPREALLTEVDKLEAAALETFDQMIEFNAGTLARYHEVVDINWVKELSNLGLNIVDLFSPTLKGIPKWLEIIKHIIGLNTDFNVISGVTWFWENMGQWHDEMPADRISRKFFYEDKILNEFKIDFEVLAGGGSHKFTYNTFGAAQIKTSIINYCEELREQIKNYPEDEIPVLIDNYPLLIKIMENYQAVFRGAKINPRGHGMAKLPPSGGIGEYKELYTTIYNEVNYWNIQTGLWERSLMNKALKLKESSDNWSWWSIGTGLTSVVLIGVGFFSGGSTWYTAGYVILQGGSIGTGVKSQREDLKARDVGIGAANFVGKQLTTGHFGFHDLMGCFIDVYTLIQKGTDTSPLLTEISNLQGSDSVVTAVSFPLVRTGSDVLSGEITSFETPDLVDNQDGYLTGTGTLIVKNTGTVYGKIGGIVTVYCSFPSAPELAPVGVTQIIATEVPPGESKIYSFTYGAPDPTILNGSYIAEARLSIYTEKTMSEIDPSTSYFSVGEERSPFSTLMEGDMSVSGESVEKRFTVSQDASGFSLSLFSGGGDFDVHLYDVDGNHVGYDYRAEDVDIEIHGANYTGNEPNPERITVFGNVAGRSFTVLVVGANRVKEESFKVLYEEIKEEAEGGQIRVTPTEYELLLEPGDFIYETLNIQEVSGVAVEVSIHVSGDASDWIVPEHSSYLIEGNGSTDIKVNVMVPPWVSYGEVYTSSLIIETGLSTYSLPFEVQIFDASTKPYLRISSIAVDEASLQDPFVDFTISYNYSFDQKTQAYIMIYDYHRVEYIDTEPEGFLELSGKDTGSIILSVNSSMIEPNNKLSADAYYWEGPEMVHSEEGWYKNFTIQIPQSELEIIEHIICGDVTEDYEPMDIKTKFYGGEDVYSWLELGGVKPGDEVNWVFLGPGSISNEMSYVTDFQGSGWAYAWMDLSDYESESVVGNWDVFVYINGVELSQAYFEVLSPVEDEIPGFPFIALIIGLILTSLLYHRKKFISSTF